MGAVNDLPVSLAFLAHYLGRLAARVASDTLGVPETDNVKVTSGSRKQ
jgi:hypothetical protein